MRLKLFFTFFGGKWRIAKYYPVPVHDTIVEPFAGSAGYSLHYPEKDVRLFDADSIICGVWDYLIRVSEGEIMALPPVVKDVRELDVPQEAKWLIGFWLNKGTISPCNIPGKWMRDHLRVEQRVNSYWGEGVKTRIASQLKHIRHWKVENRSYRDIAENERATWFVDPPYHISGFRYRHCKIDYENLAQWCMERQGQVIACEQDGAAWLPFEPFREVKTLEGKSGSKTSKEVVWVSNQ